MKENEIIKALGYCSIRSPNCKECPYYLEKDCVEKDALDLIKRKNTEIDILIRKNETLKDEVERLKNTVVDLNANLSELIHRLGSDYERTY